MWRRWRPAFGVRSAPPAASRGGKPPPSYPRLASLALALLACDVLLTAGADHAAPETWGAYLGAQVALSLGVLALECLLLRGTLMVTLGLVGHAVMRLRWGLGGAVAYVALLCCHGASKLSLLADGGAAARSPWDSSLFGLLSVAQKVGALAFYLLTVAALTDLGNSVWYDWREAGAELGKMKDQLEANYT